MHSGRINPWMRRRAGLLFALVLIVGFGCKRKSAGPDAGVERQVVSDAALRFRFEVPPSWTLSAQETSEARPLRLAEARRRTEPGRKYVVAPKLVVTVEPARTADPDMLVRSTMQDLRGLEQDGSVRIQRTTMSTRQIDGVKVGDLELTYDVRDVARDTSRKVVHRSLVAPRVYADGQVAALMLTVTYMAEDTEMVLPDIHRLFASLEFPETIEDTPSR